MPINVRCEECRAKFRVDARRANTVIECRRCGADIEVPGLPKRRDSDVDKKPRGVHWGVWVGGAGGVIAVVSLVLVVLMRGEKDGSKPTTALTTTTREKSGQQVDPLTKVQLHTAWINKWNIVRDKRYQETNALAKSMFGKIEQVFNQAVQRGDREDINRLKVDLSAFRNDHLALPQAPELREEAMKYAEDRLAVEKKYLPQIHALKNEMSAHLVAKPPSLFTKALEECERAVGTLPKSKVQLAALPTTIPSRPGRTDVASNNPTKPSTSPRVATKPNAQSSTPREKPKTNKPGSSNVASKRPTKPNDQPPAPGQWAVTVDPPQEAVTYPAELPYTSLEGVNPKRTLYPPGHFAFAAVGQGKFSIEGYVIVDLRSGKSTGAARGVTASPKPLSLESPALSPDGTYFAYYDSSKDGILVGNVTKPGGQLVEYKEFSPSIFLPRSDRLLAMTTSKNPSAKVWEVPSGKLVSSFALVEGVERAPGTVLWSPGGRYLAVAGGGSRPYKLTFYDVESGKSVGSLNAAPGGDPKKVSFTAAAFSPDGKELAALVTGTFGFQLRNAMACWDVKTGRSTYFKILQNQPGRGMLSGASAEPLQWFPDGKGWLLLQRFVVDRATATVVSTVKTQGGVSAELGTKVLDDRRVLVATATSKMEPVEVKRSKSD